MRWASTISTMASIRSMAEKYSLLIFSAADTRRAVEVKYAQVSVDSLWTW